jgi:hypothetical protein
MEKATPRVAFSIEIILSFLKRTILCSFLIVAKELSYLLEAALQVKIFPAEYP